LVELVGAAIAGLLIVSVVVVLSAETGAAIIAPVVCAVVLLAPAVPPAPYIYCAL